MQKNVGVCLAWHNLNSNNYGVSALAIAQVSLLLEAAKRAHVTVKLETLGTPSVRELAIKSEVEQRFGIRVEHHDFSLKRFLLSLAKCDLSAWRVFQPYDVVMDIGEGDSFTDIYGIKRFLSVALTKYLAVRANKKLILSPQTVGPFNHGITRSMAKYLIGKCDAVFSRDYKSTQFVRKMGFSCIEVADVAFTLPYDALPQVPDSVGINISGLLWNGGYSGANQFGLTVDYPRFVKEAIQAFRARGKEVHLIGHVIADQIPVEDDYRVCLAIKHLFIDRILSGKSMN